MNLLQFGSYSLISFVVSKNLWNPETIYVSYPLHCLFPYSMILQQLKPFLMQSCHSLPFSSPLCPAQQSVTPLSLSTYSHITSGNKGGNWNLSLGGWGLVLFWLVQLFIIQFHEQQYWQKRRWKCVAKGWEKGRTEQTQFKWVSTVLELPLKL